MLREAFIYLFDRGRESNKIQIINLDGRRQIVKTGDTHEIVDCLDPDHTIEVSDLESLTQIANDETHGQPVCYVDFGSDRVVVFFNEENRRDTLTLALCASEPFASLYSLASPQAPKEIVKKLRAELHGCLLDPEVLPALSKIDFTRNSDGRHNNEHGKESLGRSVEQQVQTSGGKVPEHITFDLPAYSTAGLRRAFRIKCVSEIDFDNQRIAIKPLGDELEMFHQATQASILKTLRDELTIPVYSGRSLVKSR